MVSGFQKLRRTHDQFVLWFQLSCKIQMEQKFQIQWIPKEGSYSFKQTWKLTTCAHSLA
jgi:hypothetical protein